MLLDICTLPYIHTIGNPLLGNKKQKIKINTFRYVPPASNLIIPKAKYLSVNPNG